jgi:hypothetical protein
MPPSQTQSASVLIITASGGGGLLQAAYAKEQQIRIGNPDAVILKKDVMRDWIGAGFGRFGVRLWNGAQQSGRVWLLSFFGIAQRAVDWALWPRIFFQAAWTLFKNRDISRVIDTQPLFTSAILKAIRLFNYWRGKAIHLEKIFVDLPTRQAIHFCRPIRKLSKKDKRYLRVHTLPPLLAEGESPGQFWRSMCNLDEEAVCYDDSGIRHAFHRLKGAPWPEGIYPLKVSFQSEEEWRAIEQTASRGRLPLYRVGNQAQLHLKPEQTVATVLLGSQPAFSATQGYARQFVQQMQSTPSHEAALFLFCGPYAAARPGQKSLFQQVVEWARTIGDWPPNLTLVPMSFQDDSVIAPLFHRSDLTITRSGGQTVMELMAVARGMICIHSEAKTGERSALLSGIPGWEAGNALYLERARGAQIVTPDTCPSILSAIGAPLSR